MKQSKIGQKKTRKVKKQSRLKKDRWGFVLRWLILLVAVWTTIVRGQYLLTVAQGTMGTIKQTTVTVVSETLGQKMQTDTQGNINVMLVWFGWEAHAWWYLADTIIVASFSPDNDSVTMISLPRDLYVGVQWQFANKINALFAWKYNKNKDLDEAARALADKAGEITGLTIPYYALIDFSWFEDLIDSLWGIEVDVPYDLIDRAYPNGMRWYEIFSVKKWPQMFDGATALKYARSRHSTSDFSRALRQQQIIKAVISEIMSASNLVNPAKWRELYDSYTDIVKTNIELEEMISLGQYAVDIPPIHSFVLTMECSTRDYRYMAPGCLLYPANREAFGGMSVILPIGAAPGRISFYDNTQFFASVVAHHQWFLNEDLQIEILNGIDKEVARQYRYRNGLASSMATKLTNFGFDIVNVDNAVETLPFSAFVYHGTGSSQQTLEALWLFMDVSPETDVLSGHIVGSGVDATIILWNDFLERFGNESFNYFR